MDGVHYTVHGVAKSRTRLSDLTNLTNIEFEDTFGHKSLPRQYIGTREENPFLSTWKTSSSLYCLIHVPAGKGKIHLSIFAEQVMKYEFEAERQCIDNWHSLQNLPSKGSSYEHTQICVFIICCFLVVDAVGIFLCQ